jgi:alkanesulfonate monooxygenase SsuD/methylene tetrahydromethanopterin reductase-like flavin-dependent oxidoreductase (luciferase family)
MILDVFSELQKAGPGGPHAERDVLREAIEQAKLADALGYGCWWTVEHHGAAPFSYSSAPEIVVAVLAQHTKRLRFGHSGILAPFRINHPLRVAERAAVTDHLSGGRLELGLARSGGSEWDTFGVAPESSREELREALRMIPEMWTRSPFRWESERLVVPERDVVPKPLQQPHPPLWQTCTSPESFEMAGSLGVGALATTLLSPLATLRALLDRYEAGLARCQPAGRFVNAQRAVFTFVHCAESRGEAIASGAAEAALWFVNAAPRVFQVPRRIWVDAIRGEFQANDPAATRSLAAPESVPDDDLDDPVPVIRLLNRQRAGLALDPEEAFEALEPMESVVIGDVEACGKKLDAFARIGVDRLMCLMAFGALPQERILASLRLVGEKLLPAQAAPRALSRPSPEAPAAAPPPADPSPLRPVR